MKKYLFMTALLLPTTGAMAQSTGTVTFVNNGTTQMAFSPSSTGTPTTGCINGGGQGGNFTVTAPSTNVSIYSATCNQGTAGTYSNISTLTNVGVGCTYPFTCTSPTSCTFGPITCPAGALNKSSNHSGALKKSSKLTK